MAPRIGSAIFLCYDNFHSRGRVAQLAERLVRNEEAGGSNPPTSTIIFSVSILAATERPDPIGKAAGSNPAPSTTSCTYSLHITLAV